tara:strand:+ start:602 stop:2365 length:1764 start_codon:yes stop_codon:yes gene_type:complete
MNNFIEWNTLNFKKESGKEKMRCPECDNSRSDKTDKSLQIDHNEGYGKCHYCNALTFKEKNEYEAKVILPKQDWQNFTKLSEGLVKWVEEERNIGQHSLIQLGITEEKQFQPALKKEINNIVFNYFEGGTVVNKKYRSASKNFTQTSGGKSIFYNINSVVGESEVWIVEGEFDVLALHHIGVKAVISVPNGANDNDEYWKNSEKYLKDVKKFIIAVDNDLKGNDLKEKIAQRLGRWRCEHVEWTNKDANGDLIKGILKESIRNRKRFPVSGTVSISELKDEIYDFYNNGLPTTIKPKSECFKDINQFFSLMRGHLCTVTGIPSHGKSEFTEWYTMNLVKDFKMKASFFTPEHAPFALHQTRFMAKAIGKPFWKSQENRITPADIERYVNWADQKIYYTMPNSGEVADWNWILDTFKQQMFSYGVDIFVIDAFNKVVGASEKKDIDAVLTKLTMFAQTNNVIIMLIAHPTKMKKLDDNTFSVPSLYDVSGSSDFRNQTHDGYAIHRDFTDNSVMFQNLKTKYNFQGEIGKSCIMNYDVPTGRYYPAGGYVPTFDLTKDFDSQEKQLSLKPNANFEFMPDEDELENCPF